MNEHQLQTITIIPRVTAAVSLASSLFIMVDVAGIASRFTPCASGDRTRKRRLDRVQPRIIFAMSLGDLIASIMFVLGDFPFPVEAGQGGSGTMSTCNAQGWLVQCVPATAIYNGMLALYYLLTIRYKKTEKQMVILERWAHGFVVAFLLITGTIGVVLGLFNPALFDCWIFMEPPFCGTPDLPCNRPYYGVNAVVFQYILYYMWIYAAIVIAAVSMYLVYRTVHSQEMRTARLSATNFSDASGAPARKQSAAAFKHSRRVAVQGLFYIGAFFLTWFMPIVEQIYTQASNQNSYPLLVISMFFIPLQGFFSLLVYIRPRYIKWRASQRWSGPVAATSRLDSETDLPRTRSQRKLRFLKTTKKTLRRFSINEFSFQEWNVNGNTSVDPSSQHVDARGDTRSVQEEKQEEEAKEDNSDGFVDHIVDLETFPPADESNRDY